ncbi:hypothetical protein J6590_076113 [Homalodisca vitripennis]|nr:hypothetical protein J6590_076113 [Homalodisca vitripennis]
MGFCFLHKAYRFSISKAVTSADWKSDYTVRLSARKNNEKKLRYDLRFTFIGILIKHARQYIRLSESRCVYLLQDELVSVIKYMGADVLYF